MHMLSSPYRSHICGYDLNLTYPSTDKYPNLTPPGLPNGTSPFGLDAERFRKEKKLFAKLKSNVDSQVTFNLNEKRDNGVERNPGREDPKIELNPQYLCRLWYEVADYALNFSMPWCKRKTLSHTTMLMNRSDLANILNSTSSGQGLNVRLSYFHRPIRSY